MPPATTSTASTSGWSWGGTPGLPGRTTKLHTTTSRKYHRPMKCWVVPSKGPSSIATATWSWRRVCSRRGSSKEATGSQTTPTRYLKSFSSITTPSHSQSIWTSSNRAAFSARPSEDSSTNNKANCKIWLFRCPALWMNCIKEWPRQLCTTAMYICCNPGAQPWRKDDLPTETKQNSLNQTWIQFMHPFGLQGIGTWMRQ